jgi:hypothetical protein
MSLLLAHSGYFILHCQCPLVGVKRTSTASVLWACSAGAGIESKQRHNRERKSEIFGTAARRSSFCGLTFCGCMWSASASPWSPLAAKSIRNNAHQAQPTFKAALVPSSDAFKRFCCSQSRRTPERGKFIKKSTASSAAMMIRGKSGL